MKMRAFKLATAVGFLVSAVLDGGLDVDFYATPSLWFAIGISVLLASTAQAQFTANNQTNTISGVASNWISASGYIVGSNTFKDVLRVINGGVLSNGTGYLGYENSGINNAVVVFGAGSVWSNALDLHIGKVGAGNSLVISNQGKVFSRETSAGDSSTSSGNSVLVTGTGSVWNVMDLELGLFGAGNSLVISNHGEVIVNGEGIIGEVSSNNSVVVTGTGSVWSNQLQLLVGQDGSGNSLTIANGGVVVDQDGYFSSDGSSSNNTILVTGAGSVWNNRGFLYVGYVGKSNVLTITGGSVIASNAYVGFALYASNNVLQVNSGSLFVTNALGKGALVVSKTDDALSPAGGKARLIINGGSVTVDSLVAINGTNSVLSLNGGTLSAGSVSIDNDQDFVVNSTFIFNDATITVHHLVLTNTVMAFPAGLIEATSTTVNNGQQFVIGNGTNGANYHLLGGVHSFNNGLRIRNAATLTGCGTVNGNVTVDSNGTVFANCGTLTFTGTVTNNYALAADGAVLEFYGTVVNNSAILLYNGGSTNFHGAFINNGIISNAGPVIVSSANRIGNDLVVQAPSTNGFRYQLQITTSMISPVWTNSGTEQPGTGGVLTFTDPGGATNGPTRFYRVDVIAP
jgi:autotransporter family porin